jgi:hypothetical protein
MSDVSAIETRHEPKNPQSIKAASAVHDSAVRLSDRERIYAIYFHYPETVGGVS